MAGALGSFIEHVGTTSRAAIISFNGNKIVTTDGGNLEILGIIKKLSILWVLAVKHPWKVEHDSIG